MMAGMNNEGSSLLGYDAGSFGQWFLTFQRHYIPLSRKKGTSYIQQKERRVTGQIMFSIGALHWCCHLKHVI
jgi:hypothetical protein